MTFLHPLRSVLRKPGKLGLALGIWAWSAFFTVAARTFSLHRALEMIEPRSNRVRRWRPEELAALVDRILGTTPFVGPACWKRAAVLRRYLLMAGVETTIVFGVRKGGGQGLEGHAWLERGGEPYLEASVPEYRETLRYPSDRMTSRRTSS